MPKPENYPPFAAHVDANQYPTIMGVVGSAGTSDTKGTAQPLPVGVREDSGALYVYNVGPAGSVSLGNITGGTINRIETIGTLEVGSITASLALNTGTITTIAAGTQNTLGTVGTIPGVGTLTNVGSLTNAGTIKEVTTVPTVTTVSNLTNGTVRISLGTIIGPAVSGAVASGGPLLIGGTDSGGTIYAAKVDTNGILQTSASLALNSGTITTIVAGTQNTLGTVGTVVGLGTVTNLGSITNIGTIKEITNIAGGTITTTLALNSGTITTITAGTQNTLGTVGVLNAGTVTKVLSVGTLAGGTIIGTINTSGGSIGLDIVGQNSVGVTVTVGGGWDGDLSFRVSIDGANWTKIRGFNPISTAYGSSIINLTGVAGTVVFPVGGFNLFQVQEQLNYSVGSAVVTMFADPANPLIQQTVLALGTITRVEGGTITNLISGTVNALASGTITAGTLTNLVSGTINALAAGTVTAGTLTNLVSGTINALAAGTITGGTLGNLNNGTLALVSNLTNGSINLLTGTVTSVSNLAGGTVRIDPTAVVAPLTFGTIGTAGGSFFATISSASGAGTKHYISGLQVIGQSGTADVRILAGTSIQGTGVLAAGIVVPGGGFVRDFNKDYQTGTNSEITYHFVGAGSAFIVVNYWKGA